MPGTPKILTSLHGSRIGLASDGSLVVNGARVSNATQDPLWAGCHGFDNDPSRFFTFFDDFLNPASATASDYHTYTSVDDSGTGTNAFQDIAGGVYNVVTAASDNDYHAMRSVNKTWDFDTAKEIWFEARFKVAEATTNESTWWFGFSDTTTTGGMQANALGPLASYDGALIWKEPETAMTVNFETSNAGVQSTLTGFATSITDTWHRAGFYFDGTATTSTITPYFHNGTSWTTGTAQPITLASTAAMYLMFGIKAGPTAAAETLQVDYIRIVQTR